MVSANLVAGIIRRLLIALDNFTVLNIRASVVPKKNSRVQLHSTLLIELHLSANPKVDCPGLARV